MVSPRSGFRILLGKSENEQVLLHLHVADIEGGGPQPRTYIAPDDPETVKLYESIKAKGQLDPIKVYKSPITPGKYRVWEGHRRNMIIFTMFRLSDIKAVDDGLTEQQAFENALIVHIRQNISAYDQGHFIEEDLKKRFPNIYTTQETIAKRLSLSQQTISNILLAYRQIEAQKSNFSPETYQTLVTKSPETIIPVTKAPEAAKPALLTAIANENLSILESKNLSREISKVPDATEQTVKEKVAVLFGSAEKEVSKIDSIIAKLVEKSVVLAPEDAVREAVGRAGDNKVTPEKLGVFMTIYFAILDKHARADKKSNEYFEEAEQEAAKW